MGDALEYSNAETHLQRLHRRANVGSVFDVRNAEAVPSADQGRPPLPGSQGLRDMSDSLQDVSTQDGPEEKLDQKVLILVDQKKHRVQPGPWLVADLKKEVKVAADRALDQLIDGQLQPLADEQTIEIRGHEQFVSHARQGGSS